MGTGKSIARAILGALGGGAEYYGDINKQRMMSSDDLYNALARLQIAEQLERSSPLYAQQLEEGKLKNRLTQAQLSEIDFVNNERAAITAKMQEAQAAQADLQAKQAERDKIIALGKQLYETSPDYNPSLPFMPTTIPTVVPGSSGDPALDIIQEQFLAEQERKYGAGAADFVSAMRQQLGGSPGPDRPMSYFKPLDTLTPEQQRMAEFAGTYEGTPEGASRAYIASLEQRSKVQAVQDEAFARAVGEKTGQAVGGGEIAEFNDFVRALPKSITEDMDMEDAIDLWLETKKRLAPRTLNPSSPAGTGFTGQPVIKLD